MAARMAIAGLALVLVCQRCACRVLVLAAFGTSYMYIRMCKYLDFADVQHHVLACASYLCTVLPWMCTHQLFVLVSLVNLHY